MAAEYTIPKQEKKTILEPFTIASSKSMTGGSICAKFKTGFNTIVAFEPTFTISEDGLTATSSPVVLDFNAALYFSNIRITYADGKILPIGKYNLTITDSTC